MDIYSTDELVGIVRNLKRVQTWLTRTFFPVVRRSMSKTVHIDVEKNKRRLAPFVHPRSQGKVVETIGRHTNSIEPAYIKDKRSYDPEEAISFRALGEALTGELTPDQREALWVTQTLIDQQEMLDRRLEWMAAQILLTGQVTITGEGFDDIVVDFQRAAGHTVQLLTTARWGESGVRPLADLATWGKTVQKASGAYPTEVVMEPDTFDLFQQDAEVQNLLDTRRGSDARMESTPTGMAVPQFKGSIGDHNFWTYQEFYVDPADDTEKDLLPQYSLIMGSSAIEGRQHYGAIRDPKAMYRPLPFYPKMWMEEDPAATFLMSQSAPILAPWRPDASFAATVR